MNDTNRYINTFISLAMSPSRNRSCFLNIHLLLKLLRYWIVKSIPIVNSSWTREDLRLTIDSNPDTFLRRIVEHRARQNRRPSFYRPHPTYTALDTQCHQSLTDPARDVVYPSSDLDQYSFNDSRHWHRFTRKPSARYQPIKRDVRRRGGIPYRWRQLHLPFAGITKPTRHLLEPEILGMTGCLRDDTDIHPRDAKKSTLPR
jgi:hypothetical protein